MAGYKFELWQEGAMVAAVHSQSRERAQREIQHYAAVYSQDGPVEIKEIKPRPSPHAQRKER